MADPARRVTIEQASLAFILVCLATIGLLDRAEIRLSAALEVAVATYDEHGPNGRPEGCAQISLEAIDKDVRSFDPRMSGYSREEAAALLCAMRANEMRAANEYLKNRFYWDMAFPIIYGPCLAVALLFLLGRIGVDGLLAYFLALFPLAGAALDIAENVQVRALIEAGPAASVADADLASLLTMAKYALVAPSFLVALFGMLIALAGASFRR